MDISSPQRPARRQFRSFRSISALILREMTSRYGRSPGGYLWALLEPIAGIALLSIVFSLVLRAPSLGTNFPYFYASGLLPFMFFISVSGQIAGSLQYSRPLLSYPVMSFVDALVARFLLNGLTQMLIMGILITGIITAFDLEPVLIWPHMFLGFGMLFALTLSIGALNCFLYNFFPVWEQVWAVMVRPLFIASGIFFIPEDLPLRAREIFIYNPVAHIISQIRKGLYATYDAPYVSPLYVFTIAMIVGGLAILLLLRNYRDILLK